MLPYAVFRLGISYFEILGFNQTTMYKFKPRNSYLSRCLSSAIYSSVLELSIPLHKGRINGI